MTPSSTPQHMVTRFAPSPTGRLHVGHGWSALLAEAMARENGGSFRLRIEDIDGTRSRPEHVAGIIEDLRWLGIAWDGEIIFQSDRLGQYEAALDRLRGMDLLYPCFCTRADIAASTSAPHGPEGPVYPGTCRALPLSERDRRIAAGEPHAWRIDMSRAIAATGQLYWKSTSSAPFGLSLSKVHPQAQGERLIEARPQTAGDVVLARKDAPASYHLSCTLDDAAMGVTHVLRGQDLFAATHVHRLLQALLNLPSPVYCHHPLLAGADGKRLAKRDGSIALADLRAQGMDPAQLAADLLAARFPVGISLAGA
ncbi:Glutamyl-tRNA synthetase [Sphingomonas paucimobilis]|nr:Glutamyl-tRNA synthetase [Sphingomonas paucimobilis]